MYTTGGSRLPATLVCPASPELGAITPTADPVPPLPFDSFHSFAAAFLYLGWKRNLLSLAPDPPRRRWSSRVPFLVWFMLPSPVAASGLAFTPDAAKVSRLRARTRAIRLGEDMHSLERQRERDDDDRWGMAPEEEGTADEDEDERDGQGAGWETRSSRRE